VKGDWWKALARRAAEGATGTVRPETEIVTMTFFDRLEDVKGFAGEQYEVAIVDPVAQALLSRYEKTVNHFEVALELGSKINNTVS
jgi:hypothetical protein